MADMIALGIGIIAIAAIALAAYAFRKQGRTGENPLQEYMHHQIGAEALAQGLKDAGVTRSLTTVGKGGRMSVRFVDNAGNAIFSYETKNPEEQETLIDARGALSHAGIRAKDIKGDTAYLEKALRKRLQRV